jgi:alpha-L-fucosidase
MRPSFLKAVAAGSLAAIVAQGLPRAAADEADTQGTHQVNVEARRWFEDAKFGLFVHWGVYSLIGKGEWVMEKDKIPISEYEKLPPQFNPTKFDAEEWVKLAQAAGMKYITVTAKHHDGFCMFDSKLTSYDIVDATPYGKDPLKALADACRKHDVKLFFYYSLLDWHHPDYYPVGRSGKTAGRAPEGNWKAYVAYYQGQVRELCTNYGEIGGLWFDGRPDKPDAEWDLEGTYKLIHTLQPRALVGNNHHSAPLPGEDFQMFERDLPGDNASGHNKAKIAQSLPLETCMPLNRSWGYKASDKNYKSPEEIVHALLGAAGRGSNLLLNVGPLPDGTIGPEFTERLREVGKWLQTNGEMVYGTRRGPVPPQPWGVSLTKSGAIYLHVLRPDEPVNVPKALQAFDARLGIGDTVLRTQTEEGFRLQLPEQARTPIDTIIVLRPIIDER